MRRLFEKANERISRALARGEEGQSYAYGGGGLLFLILVIVVIVLLLR
jgi:hypothetical protein